LFSHCTRYFYNLGDVGIGGYSKFSLGLQNIRIAERFEEENGFSFFSLPDIAAAAAAAEGAAKTKFSAPHWRR